MRRLAMTAAVISFFSLAIVGSLCGVPPFTCAIRAVVGAVVVFILAKTVVRVFVNIMVDTIVRNSSPNDKAGDYNGESGNR